MERILVAVDGSDPGKRAVAMAIDLATKYGAELTIVSVLEPVFMPPEPYVAPATGLEEANRAYLESEVNLTAKAATDAGLKVSKEIRVGPPADQILAAAESPSVGMIVIGSRGRGAVGRLLLGSVSDRVAHLSKKPVMIVH